MKNGSQQRNRSLDAYRLIGRDDLLKLLPYTMKHIYRLEKAGEFPMRVKIGRNRVAWVFSEVEQWISLRMAARGQVTSALAVNRPRQLKPCLSLRAQMREERRAKDEGEP